MYYLIAAGIMLISMFLVVFIEMRKSLHLIYIIPLTLFFFLGVYYFYEDILGYPTKKTLSENSLLISYQVRSDQTRIYLWLMKFGEQEPISIEIPYSKEDHRALEDSRKMMMSGQQVGALFKGEESDSETIGKDSLGSNKSLGGVLSINKINLSDIHPKN